MQRRQFLHRGGAAFAAALVSAGWLAGPAAAEEWNRAAFEAKKLEDVLKVLGGTDAKDSGEVTLTAPEIAENGAVVPLSVGARAAGTDQIAILIEKNPSPLAAVYQIPAGTLPELQVRVKMAQTSSVYVLARAGGRFLYTAREIKVTLGGCGG